MENIVQIKELVKRFGDMTAVDHITLDIEQGEIYGLLGPNGAGKSTTINMICGLKKPTEGSIQCFGKDTAKRMLEIKKDIGLVPQDIAVYEDLTAEENVRFFGSLYGLKGSLLKERTLEALEFVGLTERKKDMPKGFSGGMKRRLNIACAISHHPKLIIMDEPTVGIDPQSRNHILSSVRELNKMGSTIIYTTHYMEEVETLCTKIGIIDHGKLIAEGTCEELQSIVSDKKSIVIDINQLDEYNLEAIRKIKGVIEAQQREAQLIIDCLKESNCIPQIVEQLNGDGIVVNNMIMKGINLESTFLSLTGRSLRD